MKILSIETSCDETGVSILGCSGGLNNSSFQILADSLNSQIKIHVPFGGVFPALAKREHLKNLPILLDKTLKKAHLDKKKKPVDAIAVTYGPGLEPALWTGIVFAKELSKKWDVPLVPVNHMEGHIVSVFGENKKKFKINLPKNNFPILSLLVSGGHTELVLSKTWRDYKIIGETLDDAAGEAFDKVARMLGLPYPGGPEISKLAESLRGKEKQDSEGVSSASARELQQFSSNKIAYPKKLGFSLPRPMIYSKNFDFSFSGLKTAVLYLIRDLKEKDSNILQNEKIKQMIAKEFEDAVVETLVHKTRKAIEKYGAKTLIVAGGVSGNKYLKKEISVLGGSASGGKKIKVLFPSKKLATDNSVMIGIVGYLKFLEKGMKGTPHSKIKAEGNLRFN